MAVSGLNEADVDVRKFLAEEALPLLAKEEHQSGVASRCVDGPKGHDIESVEELEGPAKQSLWRSECRTLI